MSLTMRTGPFGAQPAGRFNATLSRPDPLLYFEPVPARIRALLEGETVVDSRRAMLLHESGHLPVYWFPAGDVRGGLFVASQRREEQRGKGLAAYLDARIGTRTVPEAAWEIERPDESAGFLAGHVALQWDAMDEWFAEDEQLFGHPRDPYSRIEVLRTTRHVRVSVDGHVLADSRRARMLLETNLPVRFYLPAGDVRTDLLVPSSNRSRCAYKGSAAYWHVRVATASSTTSCGPIPSPSTTPRASATSCASSTSASTSSSTASPRPARRPSGRATTASREPRPCAG